MHGSCDVELTCWHSKPYAAGRLADCGLGACLPVGWCVVAHHAWWRLKPA
jgi:hypothetical protein